jgi:hypothetical protein
MYAAEAAVAGVMELLRPFGDAPLVLKDYVKSQKHAWDEACFIPSASDRKAFERETLDGVGLYLGRVVVPPT